MAGLAPPVGAVREMAVFMVTMRCPCSSTFLWRSLTTRKDSWALYATTFVSSWSPLPIAMIVSETARCSRSCRAPAAASRSSMVCTAHCKTCFMLCWLHGLERCNQRCRIYRGCRNLFLRRGPGLYFLRNRLRWHLGARLLPAPAPVLGGGICTSAVPAVACAAAAPVLAFATAA